MTSINHGIRINEAATGTRALATIATAVIGLVAISTDADATVFPLDKPVLVTDVRAAIGKAGVNGTLAKALSAIADQCSPVVIVVRVAPGVDDAATETNIIGTTTEDGQMTGLKALLTAETQTGVRPRIIGIPGHDTNAVVTALMPVAKSLRAFVYAKAVGDIAEDVVTYRNSFSDRELMLIWPDFTDWDGSSVARALGLRALIDQTTGWHKTLSNVAVEGVTGISKAVDFDILSSSNTAGVLNDADITTIIRSQGFRYWGNRTCSDDPLYAFESTVRTGQVLKDTIAEGLVWAADKPITAQLVKDIIETINAKFRGLKTQGRIQGARAWYVAAHNSPTDLAAGKIVIDFDYTPCAPAESINLNMVITDQYYSSLADELAKLVG
ncbi:phage tail sheath subtilisin-like domain-containing protein [Asticcacaulis solisilvae]|uniref:phage tail sheath subtilisin-like domain-containing protein n=1 Tax=Asticcacaulis solisilvae TaxID=1217274 RepID=UPI003FD73CFD